jgi:hypothetical protein
MTIPKTIQEEVYNNLDKDIQSKLQRIQKENGRAFHDMMVKALTLYADLYELDKSYVFYMRSKDAKNTDLKMVENWEL